MNSRNRLIILGYFLISSIIVIYANVVTTSFTFEPYYALYPDSAGLYFLDSLTNDTLLQNDKLTNIIRSSLSNFDRSTLFLAIYAFITNRIPLPIALKIVSIFLCLVSLIIIYKIGRRFYEGSSAKAFLLAGLFLFYFLSMDSFYGGQPRNFGALLTCFFLYTLINRQFIVLPVFIMIAALFYPSLIPLFTVSSVLALLSYKIKEVKFWLCIILSMVISLFLMIGFKSQVMSGIASNLSSFQSYKLTQGVEQPVNIYNPIHIIKYFIFNLNEHSRLYRYFSYFLIGWCIFLLRRNKLVLRKELLIMLAASFISFCCIYFIHPTSASRQFVFTLPLFIIFFISDNTRFLFSSGFLKESSVVILLFLTFLIFHPLYNDITAYRKYAPVYKYISSLPEDAVIAGYPGSLLVETIPLFSKREVFYADDFEDLYLFIHNREESNNYRDELIKVLYSEDLSIICDFVSKQGIDYFLIEQGIYDTKFIRDNEPSVGFKDSVLLSKSKGENNISFLADREIVYLISTKYLCLK